MTLMKSPAISVVVPLYNKAHAVRRCLQSIVGQVFRDFEVIVVDDGSTDGGGAVAAGMEDPRIRVITQWNQGVSAARNAGIRATTADVIAFLDADDTWDSYFLAAVWGLYTEYPLAGILATGIRTYVGPALWVDSTVRFHRESPKGIISDYLSILKDGGIVTSSNVAIPRHVLNNVGMFPEGSPLGEDRDLWARVALRYPIAFDVRILAVYYVDRTGACISAPIERAFPPTVATMRKLLAAKGLPNHAEHAAKELHDWHLIDHVYSAIERRQQAYAMRLLRAERFFCLRFRAESLLLSAAIYVLPLALITLLKHSHKVLPSPLDRSDVYQGRFVVHRRHVEKDLAANERRDP